MSSTKENQHKRYVYFTPGCQVFEEKKMLCKKWRQKICCMQFWWNFIEYKTQNGQNASKTYRHARKLQYFIR